MENLLKRKRFFNIITLIFLTGFLVLPNIALGVDVESITAKEIDKYLPIPGREANALIHSLINLFHSEWLWSFGDAPEEESAVLIFMRNATRVQALNHLLVDAPIKTTFMIVQGAVRAARIFLAQDYSVILNELERESVGKAVNYGISVLFENKIRISPGAIEFKYITKEGEEKRALFQYIMIYQPTASNKGEILIRFYSPSYLEIPKNRRNISATVGMYTELTHNLPPFIIDVRGSVRNYKWIGQPAIDIDFPPEVPDLGIRPLGFLERLVLKPFEATIKEVEVIITKVAGRSIGLVNTWNAIKSFVSRIVNPFPAAVLPPTEEKNAELDSAPLPLSILPITSISPPPPPASSAGAGIKT